ncbi:tetratricopeptide repeat protein [Magnetococcus sp. PR-3]|uniref:tetratricopeptide repeat protein n=1 Tax=Magnetococcus sp. PR-3 TaxID=3120355 RepID=UPI002FCE549B
MPQNTPTKLNQAIELLQQNRLFEALSCLNQIQPHGYPSWYLIKSDTHKQLQQFHEAQQTLVLMLEQHPNHPEALNRLGILAREQEDFAAAERYFQQAARLPGEGWTALLNLSNLLKEQDKLLEAEQIYTHFLAQHPDNAQANSGYGSLLCDLSRYEEATFFLSKALSLDPNLHEARQNMGVALLKLRHFQQAEEILRDLLRRDPTHALGHEFLAQVLLVQGRLTEGWALHNRLRHQLTPSPFEGHIPIWQGEFLTGKHLLIEKEQGVGDEVMFARHFETVLQQASQVTIEADPRFKPLLTRSFAHHQPNIVTWGESQSGIKIDYRIKAGVLPHPLGWQGQKPEQATPYLKPDPRQLTLLQARYQQHAAGRTIIGLSWFTKRHEHVARLRNIPLRELVGPLHAAFGQKIFLVSLQYGDVEEEIKAVNRELGCEIYLDKTVDPIHSLEASCAQIAACDLVLSIDNSTVHCSAAMGTPVWMLTPWSPDWRWGVQGHRSYWYRDIQLFRQSRIGHWGMPMQKVLKQLGEVLG